MFAATTAGAHFIFIKNKLYEANYYWHFISFFHR